MDSKKTRGSSKTINSNFAIIDNDSVEGKTPENAALDFHKNPDNLKPQSPNNDDTGGYFLPDFIANEIDGKAPFS